MICFACHGDMLRHLDFPAITAVNGDIANKFNTTMYQLQMIIQQLVFGTMGKHSTREFERIFKVRHLMFLS
jgi:hypothetical protein